MKTKLLSTYLLAACVCFPANAQQKSNPVYLDVNKPMEERVEDALARMTLEEKVAICHAQSKFSSPGVARLGIPENWMSDGPHGIRAEVMWDEWRQASWTNDSCFAFPALTCLAATWNPELAGLYGKSVGEEARYRNKNVLLGPGVNIYRTPLNGRNFEYMGEDPYLASTMVVPYIQGVQKCGVAACVKHFAVNNQEIDRHKVDVKISDRALHEIYLPAFKAAVQKGKVWSLMGAYNRYKGEQCCHNQYLLNDILKRDWAFDGVVVSDWGGTHDTRESIFNGLDMEFGTWTDGLSWGMSNSYDNYYLATPYLNMLKNKEVGDKELNDKVRRILRLIFRTTMSKDRPYGSFVSDEHSDAGRKIAQEGIVLLQNRNNILPFESGKVRRIAVIGENAIRPMTIGGGSSSLKVKYEVSPLEGIMKQAGKEITVTYARGYTSNEFSKQDGVASAVDLTDNRSENELIKEACEAAKQADVVLFIGGLNKNEKQDCEGDDRESIELPYHQDRLIKELCKANPNTVVVIISGNAVAMPWVKEVPGIVEAWYSGSEAGHALASVLFGEVNPSGKLPFTFPVKLEDNGAHALQAYPGDGESVEYKDDIYVGYRWHDKQNIKPLFGFGHGLSYTTFSYGKPAASNKVIRAGETLTISVSVKNTGIRKGKEVVQLYIRDKKSSLPRPLKELKAFQKVELLPGQEQEVIFMIDEACLNFYDDTKQKWVVEPGDFEAMIGSSSMDIRGVASFQVVAN